MATGTKLILENYVKNGGHQMNEEKFQHYKRLLLHFWFEKYYHYLRQVEDRQARYVCKVMGCEKSFFQKGGIDKPIAHLKVHYPEMFQN